MLSSLKESAKGSPWWRVKRARTCSKVVMGKTSNVVGCDVRWKRCSAATASAWGEVKATRRIWVWGDNAQPGQSGHEQEAPPTFHYTLRTAAQCSSSAASPGRPALLLLKLVPFVDQTDARNAKKRTACGVSDRRALNRGAWR